LINVYFPCDDGSLESYDLVVEMLSTIECIITDNISSCKALFIGGDFNTDLNLNRRNALLLKDFLVDYDMKFLSNTDGVNNYSVSHTFSNEKRNCSSIIDFICFSSGLLPHVSAYTIIEDSINLSDHEPLNLTLIIPTSVDIGSALAACRSGAIVNVVKGQQSPIASPPNLMNTNSQYGTRHSPKGYSLRFDRGNIAGYYECTRVKLQPILEELTRATHALNDSYVGVRTTLHLAISPIYNRIVCALNEAAHRFIPKQKHDALKHWWDAELDALKQKAMLSNRIWVDSGKPRSGSIFDSRTHDKFCYKSLTEKRKCQDKESMSNDLHDSLLQKNSCAFWKTWKSKVCRSKQSIPCVDGSNDESIVTEKFRNYFQNIFTVNSAEHDAHITDKFNSRLSDFSKSKSDQMHWAESDYTISVELVDFAMNELHAGKAAGLDQLQTEHLINSHPILYKILSLLFNLILQLGVVPSEFGQGLLIPIPKDSGARGILKVSQFRGITISPVISKVFEHCILKLFKTYLYSSDRQFDFKKKIGCNHAIFTVRKTIDYFVENGSTVNMCCLDVASAFDRVNYRGLFLKLLDRGVLMNLINVLNDWYCKSECMVKWGNCISKAFSLTAGVRQGGVLSPILFSVYVDNILRNLNNLGCHMFGICMGSF
jgi:hypothetical protein